MCTVAAAPSLADEFAIRTIPTLIIFKGGEMTNRVSTVMQEAALKRLLGI